MPLTSVPSPHPVVITGLGAVIRAFLGGNKDVDGRVKPGQDE